MDIDTLIVVASGRVLLASFAVAALVAVLRSLGRWGVVAIFMTVVALAWILR